MKRLVKVMDLFYTIELLVFLVLLCGTIILSLLGNKLDTQLAEEKQKYAQLEKQYAELTDELNNTRVTLETCECDIIELKDALAKSEASVETYRTMYYQILEGVLADWHYAQGEATAYAPLDNKSGLCSDGNPTTTSLGYRPGPKYIAVDPKRIPYGSTIVAILPDGTVITGIAADTGSAMRNAEGILVDVYKDTYEEAIEFGRKEATILWKSNKTTN